METAFTTRLNVEISAPLARVLLINPPLNVIDLRMARELHQTLTEIESRTDISVIVFEGNAHAFSAGVDIKAHLPEQIHEMLTSFHAVIRAMVTSRKVTIAAIRGVCLGGGAELASVCDMVYTARDATWGFPEIKLGCFPPVAAVALPALVGHKRALYAWDAIHFDKGLARAEKIYLEELVSTADAREGIIAFLEKREPKWTGK